MKTENKLRVSAIQDVLSVHTGSDKYQNTVTNPNENDVLITDFSHF